MEVITTGHSAYRLEYHVVWVCKYRRRVLKLGVCTYLSKVLHKLCRSTPGVTIQAIGFDQDHLHMVMVIPPKYAIADVMGTMKSQSAGALRKAFDFLDKVYWKENVVWSPGYFVSSVGVDERVIRRYVEKQGHRDSGQLREEL